MAWPKTSRQSRGYGREWELTRKRILERDFHLCQPCLKLGRIHPANEVDHVVPKAKGGGEADENLQGICPDCHKQKTIRENGGAAKQRISVDGWPIEE